MRILNLFILLLFSIVGNCQMELGLHYRLGKSDLIDQHNTGTLDNRNSYSIGLDINKNISKYLLARIEINYETKGALYNIRGIDFVLPYLTVPLFFGVKLFNDRIRIMPGLYLATSIEETKFKAHTSPTYYFRFNRFDWGITYFCEVIPVKYKNCKVKIIHSMSYGIPPAYDLELSPPITFGQTDWIRNFKYDFGLSLSFEL